MKIGIACDHRGYPLKEEIKEELQKENYEIIDFGTNNKESCDYPDYAFLLGEAIQKKEVDFGIAICGTGIGISIACNKVKGVRCAKVDNKEEAYATRVDNDANIIAFGENMPMDKALLLIKTFIETPCSMEEKHVRRRNKIKEFEER